MNDVTTIIESKLKSGVINTFSTSFNGTDEQVQVANAEQLQPELNDFSFLCRFTQKTLVYSSVLFGFINLPGLLYFGWTNGRPHFDFNNGVDSFTTSSGSQFIQIDKFFTMGVSAKRDGNIKIFMDGVQYVSDDFTSMENVDMTFTEDMIIGETHHGLIDELIFWRDVAMSDNEMQALLYNNGYAIEPTQKKFYDAGPNQILNTVPHSRGGHLVCHYKMGDGDTAPFIRDHSGDGLTGTMINMDQSNFINQSSP